MPFRLGMLSNRAKGSPMKKVILTARPTSLIFQQNSISRINAVAASSAETVSALSQ